MAKSPAVLLYDANGNALANNLTGQYVSVRDRKAQHSLEEINEHLESIAEDGLRSRGSTGVRGTKASGATADRRPVLVGGRDSNNLTRTLLTDSSGTLLTRASQINHYSCFYRATSRPYALSKVFTANTRQQFATIHHLSTSLNWILRVRKVTFQLESISATAILMVDFVRLTGVDVPSGGTTLNQTPLLTPVTWSAAPANDLRAAGQATCMSLPSTPATEDSGSVIASVEYNLGVTGAASTINPPPPLTEIVLWAPTSDENQLPTLMNGVQGGFAVTVDCNAASTVKGYVKIEFSEEFVG